ncbi:uncharacterized protein LOC131318649 isoform X3 [Rhododendron vialii]|uniref:uncharacterized protein LOC131318649 isoform X3 n=1 Tax=Rhododendron vialii TaxID=182163 RepID=UPI00265F3E80|nr:uncharacterized protein LOC131318649 isoform X3 [Rhododendron vialii]
MAAEKILSTIAANVLSSLGSYAIQHIGLPWGVKGELRKMENNIFTINNVLLDAEEQQLRNRTVKEWLERLKLILYDAEDLLDEVATETKRRQVESLMRKVADMNCSLSYVCSALPLFVVELESSGFLALGVVLVLVCWVTVLQFCVFHSHDSWSIRLVVHAPSLKSHLIGISYLIFFSNVPAQGIMFRNTPKCLGPSIVTCLIPVLQDSSCCFFALFCGRTYLFGGLSVMQRLYVLSFSLYE